MSGRYSAAARSPAIRVRVRMVTNSSALVGWMPIVRSKSGLGGAGRQRHADALHHLRHVVAQHVHAQHALARLVHDHLHQRLLPGRPLMTWRIGVNRAT